MEIELSKNSCTALDQLVTARSAAIQVAQAIVQAAEQAANTAIGPVDQALNNKIQALLEAHDVPEGDIYTYNSEKKKLVFDEEATKKAKEEKNPSKPEEPEGKD